MTWLRRLLRRKVCDHKLNFSTKRWLSDDDTPMCSFNCLDCGWSDCGDVHADPNDWAAVAVVVRNGVEESRCVGVYPPPATPPQPTTKPRETTMSREYTKQAKSAAKDMAENFIDEIVEQFMEKGKVSDDINNDYDGGDSYHHETHVDVSYNPKEAMELLTELDEYEETDRGLWQGVEGWKEQMAAVAAYTYGNAVYSMFTNIVEKINGDDELDTLKQEYDDAEDAEHESSQTDLAAAIKARIEVIIKESAPKDEA